jgi:hypothetical protein
MLKRLSVLLINSLLNLLYPKVMQYSITEQNRYGDIFHLSDEQQLNIIPLAAL